jgi:pantoate--beta-alanine ligase
METVITLEELRAEREKLSRPVGLVPTMGYLHLGHLSLVQQARKQCASVVVSIFVNPTQFGPQEDLAAYPRDLARDLEMLKASNTDLVWTPAPEGMYPPGFQTWITVEEVTRPLEGSMRPHHFRGVATVVAKLFNAVQPDKAYFGQKDAQQARMIQRMVQDLNFPLEVVICPIVREADGLAMSSRNVYLSPEERRAAPVLYRSLQAARSSYENGERDASCLRQIIQDTLAQEPLARPQYVSCSDAESLQELSRVEGPALLSMAVYFGKTRLIDNLVLGR